MAIAQTSLDVATMDCLCLIMNTQMLLILNCRCIKDNTVAKTALADVKDTQMVNKFQVNSALRPSRVAKSGTSFGWGKGGNVTSAMWHVSSRSGVATLRTAIRLLLTKWSVVKDKHVKIKPRIYVKQNGMPTLRLYTDLSCVSLQLFCCRPRKVSRPRKGQHDDCTALNGLH